MSTDYIEELRNTWIKMYSENSESCSRAWEVKGYMTPANREDSYLEDLIALGNHYIREDAKK
jgi:hypothetical protein